MRRIPLQSIDINLRKEDNIIKANEENSDVDSKILSLISMRANLEKADISSYLPYLKEALTHFYNTETDYMMNIDEFTLIQDEVTFTIRSYLVDWIIDVHDRLNFVPETLYLTLNIIDRFLSLRKVPKNKLHLVGIASLFIASKYEEVIPPSIKTFVALGDENFNDRDLGNVEKYILQVLDYKLDFPSPLNYLRMVSKADNYNKLVRNMGKYFLEITFLDEKMNSIRYSIRAIAAMYTSRIILNINEYEELFWYYSGFEKNEIEECFNLIIEFLKKNVVYKFITKKYSSRRFEEVAYKIDNLLLMRDLEK